MTDEIQIPEPDSSMVLRPHDKLILVYRESITTETADRIKAQIGEKIDNEVLIISGPQALVYRP